MNKNKKRLSKLLIPMLAVSGINVNAMEKVKSMKDYPLPLSENLKCDCEHNYVNQAAEAKWNNPGALMTKQQLEKFLNDHRQDIFYAMHQGDEARAIANGKILRSQNRLINLFKRWRHRTTQNPKPLKVEYTEEQKKAIEEYNKKWPKDNNNLQKRLEKALRTDLSFDARNGYKKNWKRLGRGTLHESGYTTDTNFMPIELRRAEEGDVNCTIWAALIQWFLNENGYPARIYKRPGHAFVVTPVTGKGKKGLNLCYVRVNETAPSLDDADIKLDYLCTKDLKDGVWLGMNEQYQSKFSRDGYQYSPTFLQFFDIAFPDSGLSAEQIHGLTTGLAANFRYWHKQGKISTDMTKKTKIRTFPLKILPRDGSIVYVPLNLEYLEHAIKDEKGNILYTKKQGAPGRDDKTNLIYAKYSLATAMNANGNKLDSKLLEKNLCVEFDPRSKKSRCWLFSDLAPTYKWGDFKRDYNHDAEICGLDTSPEDAVIFWNDPNYRDPIK